MKPGERTDQFADFWFGAQKISTLLQAGVKKHRQYKRCKAVRDKSIHLKMHNGDNSAVKHVVNAFTTT